ncbi:MAG: TolC family protein [Polyangiaceae bacterium]
MDTYSLRRHAVAGVVLGLALQLPALGRAEHDHHATGALGPTLDLQTTLSRALQRAPELDVARASQRGAGQLVRSTRGALSLPPRVEISAGPRFGDSTGLDASLGVWADFPMAGVAGARRRVAATRVSAANHELAEVRVAVGLAAGVAWVDARLARELLRVRKASLEQARKLEQLARARADAQSATRGELASAEALAGSARAAVFAAQGDQFMADAELAYRLGLGEGRGLRVVGRVDADGPALREASVLAEARQHPRLQRLMLEAKALNHAAEQSLAEGTSALALGPSVTREATGDWIVLGRVSVPLGVVNPGKFEASERRRLAAVARAHAAQQAIRQQTQARMLWHERTHARRTRDALGASAVKPAKSALEEALLRYGEGKAPLSDVLLARRAAMETEERWLQAAAEARRVEMELFAAMGRLPDGRRP